MEDSSPPRDLRKRRRNRNRTRVTRACDRCKARKIKCNGIQPCIFCSHAGAMCTYESAYNRGRLPSVVPADSSTLETTMDSIEAMGTIGHSEYARPESVVTPRQQQQQQSAYLPVQSEGAAGLNIQGYHHLHDPHLDSHLATPPPVSGSVVAPLQPSLQSSSSSSRPNSPEPQTDLQGHYIGPASGVSFLLRLQKRLHQAVSFSHPDSIFTFGDAPLHHPSEFDPSFCMMLPREDAQRLLDRYFDYAMPTYRFLHFPTVQKWFTEFYDSLGAMNDGSGAAAKAALLFMIFAHAWAYMPDEDKPGPPDLSVRYYLAAEHLLAKEKGSVRLTSVQARLLQCYYLLTRSRINHCWNQFGTVTRLALAIGLHRNKRPDAPIAHRGAGNGGDHLGLIESECRRRTFWCAYTLDAYLSLSLGRPPTFHDDDIDTELPACVDDNAITAGHMAPSPSGMSGGLSVMLAPVAHMKLAQIINRLLRSLYSIKPISADKRAALAAQIADDLTNWRSDLARFLDADLFSISQLIPIFQRQRNVLNLTYWHAVILTYRPFVLHNGDVSSTTDGPTADEKVQKCLSAAMNIANTIREIVESRQLTAAFWITAYFAFSATIVLYVYVIQKGGRRALSSPSSTASSSAVYSEYLAAAIQCQSHISRFAEKGSLSERYFLVLEELRIEALRQTNGGAGVGAGAGAGAGAGGGGSSTNPPLMYLHPDGTSATDMTAGFIGSSAAAAAPQLNFGSLPNAMPPSATAANTMIDSTEWEQFALMLSSGLGNLDVFNDSFYQE
ncbi:hypothetical protein Sste5346_003039 [Sporothrix stenoceras]|uniref:Zn(2)-C6 fungal-type domain-containing protein n=1 Tax=Sporothrix stenoceras TaxID=5173 RepID=A0ABR3ZFZ8_9PEZI